MKNRAMNSSATSAPRMMPNHRRASRAVSLSIKLLDYCFENFGTLSLRAKNIQNFEVPILDNSGQRIGDGIDEGLPLPEAGLPGPVGGGLEHRVAHGPLVKLGAVLVLDAAANSVTYGNVTYWPGTQPPQDLPPSASAGSGK